MGQALRFTPGVFYVPSSTTISTIYIRGYSESQGVGYYLDGIPIGDTFRGQASSLTDVGAFTTWGLSEISVSKGYVSPAFGADGLGGAVNMVTSIPTKDLEFGAKYTFIADNENRFDAQVGRNFGDEYFQINYSQMDRKSLQYSYDYSNGGLANDRDIPNTRRKIRILRGKYGWVINDNHEYSVNFHYQDMAFNGGWNFLDYDATTLYLLGSSKFSDLVSLDSRVYYHMNLNQTYNSAKYDDYTTGFIESLKFNLSENQNLKVGVNVKHDSHKRQQVGQDFLFRDFKTLNSSAFTEYALRINSIFRFALSGSYDRSDGLRIKERYAPSWGQVNDEFVDSKKVHMQGWSLQGILYAHLNDYTLLHANVGRKTNIPNMARLYSNYGHASYSAYVATTSNLQPESALNYELGATFNYGSTQVGAAAFYNDINNMIINVRTDASECAASGLANGNGYCYYQKNADVGYSYGGEAFVKQGLFDDKLVLGANWSYTQRKSYNYDTNGNRTTTSEFTTHPRQNINVSALIAPRKEYNVSFNGSVQTSRWAYVSADDDYVRIPTVVYFDMVASYQLKDSLILSLGAYNLFDRNYNYSSSATGTNAASVGGLPGRRVFSSIEYRY